MRTQESGLWNWLRDGSASLVPQLHIRRIENLLSKGDPDVEGCMRGSGFVCELKSITARPSKFRLWCEVKTEQARFLVARRRAGGRAWLLVQVGMGTAANRYLIDGCDAYDLTQLIYESELLSMSKCKPKDDARTILLRMAL